MIKFTAIINYDYDFISEDDIHLICEDLRPLLMIISAPIEKKPYFVDRVRGTTLFSNKSKIDLEKFRIDYMASLSGGYKPEVLIDYDCRVDNKSYREILKSNDTKYDFIKATSNATYTENEILKDIDRQIIFLVNDNLEEYNNLTAGIKELVKEYAYSGDVFYLTKYKNNDLYSYTKFFNDTGNDFVNNFNGKWNNKIVLLGINRDLINEEYINNCFDIVIDNHRELTTNNKKDLDIIIPYYIVNDAIEQCIYQNVLLFRDYKNIQFVLVSDASESSNRIKRKLKNFNNIKFIDLEYNQGPGAARNAGLDNSNSDYVLFWDSDDLMISSAIGDAIINSNADIISFKIYNFYNNNNNMYRKAYKREFLDKNDLKFLNVYKEEDTILTNLCIYMPGTPLDLDKVYGIHNYAYNENSLCSDYMGKELKTHMINWLFSIFVCKKILLNKLGKDEDTIKQFSDNIINNQHNRTEFKEDLDFINSYIIKTFLKEKSNPEEDDRFKAIVKSMIDDSKFNTPMINILSELYFDGKKLY